MQWRSLDIAPRDVTLATGESLRTVASFQGSESDHDIIKAHVALDGGDFVLVTEFEDPSGKRKLGRTTQWPAQIVASLGVVAEEVEAQTAQDPMAGLTDEQRVAYKDGRLAPGGAIIPPAQISTTEMHPDEVQTGGSGDPAAPAVEEPSLEQPDLTQPEPPADLSQPAKDDDLHF